MFLNSMFSQMFTGIDGEGPFGGDQATGVWRSFLTDEYSKSFAKTGGIGLAKSSTFPVGAARGASRNERRRSQCPPADRDGGRSRKTWSGICSPRWMRSSRTVEQETELVRGGKLKDAAALEATKAELARAYVDDTAQVKANLPALKTQVPDLLAALRKQHDTFNALLQINLTVLATAHAVSEGLIRGAHAEVARKNAPQTYGNSGRHGAPAKTAAVPVSVSRSLRSDCVGYATHAGGVELC